MEHSREHRWRHRFLLAVIIPEHRWLAASEEEEWHEWEEKSKHDSVVQG